MVSEHSCFHSSESEVVRLAAWLVGSVHCTLQTHYLVWPGPSRMFIADNGHDDDNNPTRDRHNQRCRRRRRQVTKTFSGKNGKTRQTDEAVSCKLEKTPMPAHSYVQCIGFPKSEDVHCNSKRIQLPCLHFGSS
jgi:hypothetical protein